MNNYVWLFPLWITKLFSCYKETKFKVLAIDTMTIVTYKRKKMVFLPPPFLPCPLPLFLFQKKLSIKRKSKLNLLFNKIREFSGKWQNLHGILKELIRTLEISGILLELPRKKITGEIEVIQISVRKVDKELYKYEKDYVNSMKLNYFF